MNANWTWSIRSLFSGDCRQTLSTISLTVGSSLWSSSRRNCATYLLFGGHRTLRWVPPSSCLTSLSRIFSWTHHLSWGSRFSTTVWSLVSMVAHRNRCRVYLAFSPCLMKLCPWKRNFCWWRNYIFCEVLVASTWAKFRFWWSWLGCDTWSENPFLTLFLLMCLALLVFQLQKRH